MFLKARLASATLGYATRCACNRSAAFAKSSHPQRKRSDERTRTKDGQFTDAFPKLLPQDVDRVGGPSGTRTYNRLIQSQVAYQLADSSILAARLN